MNVQQRVFESQLYFCFLFRFAKIWSIRYQRTKAVQKNQFQFLLAFGYLYVNQALDPYPSVRVSQKMNIVNPQISKWLEYYALAKASLFFFFLFITDLFPVICFYWKKLKLIMTHCISGTWQAVLGSRPLFGNNHCVLCTASWCLMMKQSLHWAPSTPAFSLPTATFRLFCA